MDTWAPAYDRATLSNAYVYRLEREAFADWVVSELRAVGLEPESASVLDAGCGTGTVIEMLAERGVDRLTGLDLTPAMLDRARHRRIPGASWVEGSIERPPLEGRRFDAILACFTLHHLHDIAAFFRLLDSALQPGGRPFVLEYDAAADIWPDPDRTSLVKTGGDVLRAAFAWKNRRALEALPSLRREFNPAHRPHGFEEIVAAANGFGPWELRRVSRGVLLPALTHVLVEDSRLDRRIARLAGAADRYLARRTGGIFQWVTGRRKEGGPSRGG